MTKRKKKSETKIYRSFEKLKNRYSPIPIDFKILILISSPSSNTIFLRSRKSEEEKSQTKISIYRSFEKLGKIDILLNPLECFFAQILILISCPSSLSFDLEKKEIAKRNHRQKYRYTDLSLNLECFILPKFQGVSNSQIPNFKILILISSPQRRLSFDLEKAEREEKS